MKIYTKVGDKGTTSLLGTEKLSKADLRLQCMGGLDELNCQIGVILALSPSQLVKNQLLSIQHQLFNLGANLAGAELKLRRDNITTLEQSIDKLEEKLPKLTAFILPGGGIKSAHCHLARAVCRRIERLFVSVQDSGEDVPDYSLQYLNRLSDWLFVCARILAKETDEKETLWDATYHG